MAATTRCPVCRKEVSFNDPNMPFCSDRCRILDLGNWASEKYVISTPVLPDEIEDLGNPEDSTGRGE
ncbi:MAG: DNA gyrase inhibitor YacG [Acidobacteriota bacterium]|nr:DNA gyrase inhibitor YacG [Acidobacteriota bacterium]